jgi:hypothetical protein
MARAATVAELAVWTGRPSTDPLLADVLTPALDVLDRYYATDQATDDVVKHAHLHVAAYLLSAGQAPSGMVDGGVLGATFIPARLPIVDRMLPRRGGFA